MIAIAKFFANRIKDNKTTFENVPKLLKDKVEEVLIKSGYEHLIQIEENV